MSDQEFANFLGSSISLMFSFLKTTLILEPIYVIAWILHFSLIDFLVPALDIVCRFMSIVLICIVAIFITLILFMALTMNTAIQTVPDEGKLDSFLKAFFFNAISLQEDIKEEKEEGLIGRFTSRYKKIFSNNLTYQLISSSFDRNIIPLGFMKLAVFRQRGTSDTFFVVGIFGGWFPIPYQSR